MRKVFLTALLMLAVFAVAGALGASADATEPVWVVNTHTLKAGETGAANLKLTKPKIKWEDKTTTAKFEVECKKATGETELKGGFPGTDKLTALAFEECALIKGGTACKLTAASVMAEELPGWPTELKGAVSDAATGVRFSLGLNGCEKGSFNKTWVFKGTLKATLKNEAATIKLTLPTLAGGAEGLEAEGDEASLSGTGELENKAGGSLAAEVAIPRWYNEANERFAEGLATNVTFENVGNTVVGGKLEGVETEIVCQVFEGEGTIENPVGKAGRNGYVVIAKKCTVPKPGGTCKILKESFHVTIPVSEAGLFFSMLVYKGTTIFDELRVTAGIKIEGCENASLNKEWTLGGTAVGEPNNVTSTLKFTLTSGSNVKLGGQPATFIAEDRLEVEGGGKIKVG